MLLIGADVLDGLHATLHRDRLVALGLACLATGATVDVVSFSLGAAGDAYAPLGELLQRADRVVARDRHSQLRCLERFGRSADCAPDAALLHPPRSDPAVASPGSVALNISGMAERAWARAGRLADLVAEGLRGAGPGQQANLISHDTRALVGDGPALERLAGSCLERGVDVAPLPGSRPAPRELRQRMARCEVVVTGRLHLALAAMSVGVPALGLSYADKWHGTWEMVGLPEWLLLAPGASATARITEAVTRARQEGMALRRQILQAAQCAHANAAGHLPTATTS